MRRVAAIVAAMGLLVGMGLPAAAQQTGAQQTGAGSEGLFDSGKLLATAGVSEIEGAGGGGLTPWALITGYETRDGIGANTHYTFVNTPSFTLQSTGAAIGLYDRVELSYAREMFDTRSTGAKLGLGNGYTFNEDVLGAKVRVAGDAVYDQDSWMPQIALGTQFKRNDSPSVLQAIGARSAEGVDFYAAATKLFLAESLLVNATVRATKANQLGILGFGGDRSDSYHAEFEGSAAFLLSRNVAIGAEYRQQPNNMSFATEDRWIDAFIAYFPTRNLSLTLAAVDLGSVAGQSGQRGVYLSAQIGF
ncbi:MAG TPA: DUF3034 family protein [Stellaceae bacterium]|jgi:hypothetical protein